MYYFLILSIAAATFNSIFLNRARLSGKGQVFNFNLIVSALWCVILFALNKGALNINADVLFWGILYGIVQALFVLFKTLAMGSGPVGVTTMIGNSSLLVSITVSLIVWREAFTKFDIFGVIILIGAMFLCTYKKDSKSFSKLWPIYTAVFFTFASCTGLTFKAFGKSDGADYCSDMMLVAAIVMVVCFSVLSLASGGFKELKPCVKNKSFMLYALFSGILSCVYNRLNIFLAGKIDAVIFFPSCNGGVILLSALLGVILCKEKLNVKQIIGILSGAFAIALIGIL